MKDHEGDCRAFIWGSQAYYWERSNVQNFDDEITFGLFSPQGGTSREMSVRWRELSGASVPELRVFDDAWSTLSTFKDVIDKMAGVDNDNVTPQGFVDILLSCGFKDNTKRISPYADEGPPESPFFVDDNGILGYNDNPNLPPVEAYDLRNTQRDAQSFVTWLNMMVSR